MLAAPDSDLASSAAGGGEGTAGYIETLVKPSTQRSEDRIPIQTSSTNIYLWLGYFSGSTM